MRSYPIYILSILISILMSACHKDEPAPDPVDKKTAILVYAVASNNLNEDFHNDRDEMLDGLSNVDLNVVDYYLYSVEKSSSDTNPPSLTKAVKNNKGEVSFKTVKTYDRNTFSTDPKRISEVISDFATSTTAPTRGLFLWSHATSWEPSGSDHILIPREANIPTEDSGADTSDIVKVNIPDLKWFGQDINGKQDDYCDIIELADAIPDSYFNFIWWDCCYMSSIEVAYQFRHKAEMMVAYPTEVLAEGAPYDLILPFVAKESPNLIAAADAMSDYYSRNDKTYTIAILDLSVIEDVADMAKSAVPGKRLYAYQLLKYSRGAHRYYDFGQYTRTWGESLGDDWNSDDFNHVMDKFVVYKSCSDVLINNVRVDRNNFYGISTHYIDFDFDPEWATSDAPELYYRQLDWYKRIFNE